MKDYYQILALSPDASEEEVRRAYRRLALKHTFTRNVDELLAVYEEIRQARRRAEEEAAPRLEEPFVCRRCGVLDGVAQRRAPSAHTGVMS